MATDAKIRITAQDDTARAFASVRASLSSLSGAASSLGVLGGIFSVAGVAAFAQQAIAGAAALDDMAESTGASVESLSRLTNIAKISGQDIGTVETALVRLTKALSGSDEETRGAGEAFKALGLSVNELKNQAPDQALEAVAKALNRFEDGAGKTSVALALFGRSGAQLLPLLKDIANDTDTLATVTGQSAEEAEKLEKAWNRLKLQAGTVGQSIAMDLVNPVTVTFRILSDMVANALDMLTTFGEVAKKVASLDIQGALQAKMDFKARVAGREKSLADMLEEIANPTGTVVQPSRRELPVVDAGSGAGPKAKAETDNRARDLAASLEALQKIDDEARELGNKFLMEQSEAAEKLRQKYLELIDPVEKYRQQLEEIDRLESEGGLSADQAAEARFKINEAMDKAVGINEKLTEGLKEQNDVARELGLTMSSAFEDAAIEGKNLSDVLQGLAKDIARIVLRKTVTEPMAKLLTGALGDIIPSFDVGTDFVPRDTLAMVHRGERIIPASQNVAGAGGGMTYAPVISIDARNSTLSAPQIEGIVRRAVSDSVMAVKALADRGGNYARATGRR
ncbi:MAG TPA: hypothetical protein VF104_02565 [Burkholderiales bacterium]